MTTAAKVLREAEALATPSQADDRRISALARALLLRTRRAASRYPEVRSVRLGGSFAKGTWLQESVDLDIFVRIAPGTPEARFESVGLAVGAAATRGHPRGKKFAQHPYTEAEVEGTKVNIVPCYAVKKGQWKSAADRSLFHAELVSALPDTKKAQVRLLKTFMAAVGVYGAEIEVRGFSGYAAEVLVMNHGTFMGVLKHFAKVKVPEGERPFRLPDPVDPARDLGIAVSGEKLGAMVLAARGFLRGPSGAYFREMKGKEHPEMRDSVVALIFNHALLSEDTLWGELRKATRHLVRHLELNGFKVARSMAASDNGRNSAILIIPETTTLPGIEQRLGPTVDRERDLEAFISSGGGRAKLVWVDDDARVRLLRPRKHTSLVGLITDTAKGKEGPIGSPAELQRAMRRSGRVLTGPRLERAASSAGWLDCGIREIVSDAIGTSGS